MPEPLALRSVSRCPAGQSVYPFVEDFWGAPSCMRWKGLRTLDRLVRCLGARTVQILFVRRQEAVEDLVTTRWDLSVVCGHTGVAGASEC